MANHMPGWQIGNYRIIQLLGQGGFAEVYLAEHIHLETLVAIKILKQFMDSDHLREDFKQEARTVAILDHPHILPILDFGFHQENIPYLIMKYASNGTLRARHPKGTCVPLLTIVSYVKQIAAALQYAHDAKLIHRDVKPENMLLDSYNNVLLSDFGIAVIAHSTSSMNTQNTSGTIPYMAPEHLQGKPRSASDQYSLGIVVYEWLSGNRPFHGTFTEICSQHLTAPVPSLRDQHPSIPYEVEQVVFKALAKKPQERFVHITDFAAALERAAQGVVTTQMPFTLPSRFKLEDTKDRHSLETPPQHSTYPLSATVSNVAGSSSPRYFITPLSRRYIVFGLCGLTLGAGALTGWKLLQSPPRSSAISTPKTTPTSIHSSTAISTPQPEATSSPSSTNSSAPSSRILYFGSTDNNLYALNPSDKTVLWRFQGGNWMNSRPAVVNNVVYAGSNDANLYALNASNGTSLWRYQTGNQVVSWPEVVNGAVYFGSWDHYVYALNASNGTLLWRYLTGDTITSSPQVVNGVLYIGSNDSYIYAIDANKGLLLWKFQTGAGVATLATVTKGTVYVGSGDHTLYALRSSNGKLLWSYPTGDAIYSSPAVANGAVYFGSWDSYFYALRASDGGLLWRFQTGGKVASLPTILNGVVYMASSDHYVYALNASDGTLLWRYLTNGFMSSLPVIADTIIYIGGSDGLYALHTNGTLLWYFNANGAVTTPTIVP